MLHQLEQTDKVAYSMALHSQKRLAKHSTSTKAWLTHLPPMLRKRNALFNNCENIQDCKINTNSFVFYLPGANYIYQQQIQWYLHVSANFAELCRSCCFSRVTDKLTLFQNILSGIRCYFSSCHSISLQQLCQYFISIVYYQYVSLYTDTIIRESLMLRFRNFDGMSYKQNVAFSQLRRNVI